MRTPAALLTIIICSLLLSGCWDTNEPERLVYATGIGLDYKHGEYTLYAQIINMSGLAKTEGGQPPKDPANIGTAKGRTLDEAIFNLYHTLDRKIYWGHLSFVIFSENALKSGQLKITTDFLDRYRETRYRIFYYTTKDSIKDAMLSAPIEGISLAFSKLSDPKGSFDQSSLVQPLDIRELLIKLNEPPKIAAIPLIKITKQWSGVKSKKTNLLIEDMAVVSKDKYYGIFPKKELLGARFIYKDFERDYITLYKNTNNIITAVIHDKHQDITPVYKNGKLSFDIKMRLKANIEIVKKRTKKDKFEKEIAKVIKSQIRHTYKFGAKKNVDVYHLSEMLYRKDLNMWKKIQKNGQIPLTDNLIGKIDISIQMQNSGKQVLIPVLE